MLIDARGGFSRAVRFAVRTFRARFEQHGEDGGAALRGTWVFAPPDPLSTIKWTEISRRRALQPRGDRMSFRFATELKCGSTV